MVKKASSIIDLKVIFLMFTEGYRPTDGDQLLKEDVCFEAMRVASAMHKHEAFRSSKLNALLAMMCYKTARLTARMQGGEEFIRLKDTLALPDPLTFTLRLPDVGLGYTFRAN